MRLLKLLAAALLLLQPVAALAQTVWEMPTEYPENAMPGEVGSVASSTMPIPSSASPMPPKMPTG